MNTLRYALRFLLRARTYTLINLLGLAFSLACCIILLRYIHRELTVDAHGQDLSTIVVPLRDIEGTVYPGENPVRESDGVFALDRKWIREQCRVVEEENASIFSGDRAFQSDLFAVDSTFFHFFSYQVVEGILALSRPDVVILTEKYARRLFGKESPIGKKLMYGKWTLTVIGVLKEPVCKTTWNFDLLVSRQLKPNWGKLNIELMRVDPHLNLEEVNKQTNVYRKYPYDERALCRYRYIGWKDFYFESSIADKYNRIFQFGNRNYVYILLGVDIFLFLIGILSFVNLYSVTMLKRTRMYGLKKVFGISRGRLFVEIYLENLLMMAGAILLAWGIIELSSRYITHLFGESVPGTFFDWVLTGSLLVVLPLLASFVFYVRYGLKNPVSCMRFYQAGKSKSVYRQVFLFIQYAITMLLMILAFYFQHHFDFLMHTSHGYTTQGILSADLYRENSYSAYESLTSEQQQRQWACREAINQKLDECPFIESWMTSSRDFLRGYFTDIINDKGEKFPLYVMFTSTDFMKMLGLKVKEGQIGEIDSYEHYQIALNETAMKTLGYDTLEKAAVRSVSPLWIAMVQGKVVEYGTSMMQVNAVVKDFFPQRLTDGVPPMLLVISSKSLGAALIKAVPGREKELVPYLKKIEQEVYHTDDFTYQWMDDKVAEMYKDDERTSDIYTLFSYMAIWVSCLGLLGISLFEIRRRYREIAIRKVNGATRRDLYLLLVRRYLLVQLLAFVVAAPVAWLMIQHYTATFVEKAPVTVGLFLIPFLVVMVLSVLTLYWQMNRASRINPSEVMKSE